jgi:hypothetical protein
LIRISVSNMPEYGSLKEILFLTVEDGTVSILHQNNYNYLIMIIEQKLYYKK